jgi:SAM-dependent methyltransferase
MGREASKTLRMWHCRWRSLLEGDGIDIGCGDDPVTPDVKRFDRIHGDAQEISRYVDGTFDFVFASHVLEHMENPQIALEQWFGLVRPGGHLIVLVPDEDLYEQGHYPSLFNDDHKWTFTISKERSWSPVSLNLLDVARSVPGVIVSLELQDRGYDRRLARHTPGRRGLRLFTLHRHFSRRIRSAAARRWLGLTFNAFGMPIDQTAFPDDRLAQIQLVVRKSAAEQNRDGQREWGDSWASRESAAVAASVAASSK